MPPGGSWGVARLLQPIKIIAIGIALFIHGILKRGAIHFVGYRFVIPPRELRDEHRLTSSLGKEVVDGFLQQVFCSIAYKHLLLIDIIDL